MVDPQKRSLVPNCLLGVARVFAQHDSRRLIRLAGATVPKNYHSREHSPCERSYIRQSGGGGESRKRTPTTPPSLSGSVSTLYPPGFPFPG